MNTLANLVPLEQSLSALPAACDAVVWGTALPASVRGNVEATDARDRIAMTNGHTFPGTRAWSPPI